MVVRGGLRLAQVCPFDLQEERERAGGISGEEPIRPRAGQWGTDGQGGDGSLQVTVWI